MNRRQERVNVQLRQSNCRVILPYARHITYGRNRWYGSDYTVSEKPRPKHVKKEILPPIARDAIYDSPDRCIYCHSRLVCTDEPQQAAKPEKGDHFLLTTTFTNATSFACRNCGWWLLRLIHGADYPDGSDRNCKIHEGIIQDFEVSASFLPVFQLRKQLVERGASLCDMNPTALEALIGAVLRDHFQCEVEHVGGPGDNGVDLLLVLRGNQKPCFVQVKRRCNPQKAEPVSVIREFVGTMIVGGVNRGIVVSTAYNFSKSAKMTAEQARQRCGIEVSLYNQSKIRELLSLTEPPDKPWLPLLEAIPKT